jgi:ABC-type proline/glycine betaine transport system ATPase subunit
VVQQGSFADLIERPAGEFVVRFVRAQSRPGTPS